MVHLDLLPANTVEASSAYAMIRRPRKSAAIYTDDRASLNEPLELYDSAQVGTIHDNVLKHSPNNLPQRYVRSHINAGASFETSLIG